MSLKKSTIKEQIFFTGSDYFQNLLDDINHAQLSIDLEMYIFAQDFIGNQFIDALTKAAERKVKVRVLVDGVGTPEWGGEKITKLEQAGAETRIFRPLPWRFWQWHKTKIKKPFIKKIIYLFLFANARNHRKTCIIDNQIIYTGSFNIIKDHINKKQQGEGWRDTGIRLENIDTALLIETFENVWYHRHVAKPEKTAAGTVEIDSIIRLNNTRRKRRNLYKSLLKKIRNCKKRIWITNAYFIPDGFLLRALVKAAHKNIDVRILLPQKTDIPFLPWAASIFYENLLKSGAKIYEFLPSMLHAKTLIIDDWMIIGSSNLDHRSLLHNLELDINIQLQETKKLLEQQFLKDLKKAKKVNLTDWKKRPLYQRIIGRLYLYVKYWV